MPHRIAPKLNIEYLNQNDWWSRVGRAGPDDCWLWLMSVGSHGYGQTWDGVTVRLAHRVAWTLTHGEIPDDMTVDHDQDVCKTGGRCCNPAHLRLMSNIENATDNRQGRKTHCPRGHEYTPMNTRTNDRGHRWCIECQHAYNASRSRNAAF